MPAMRRAGERRGVWRRHQPVGVLVVLVDADDVEAEALGRHQLVEILLVERVAAARVVERVGHGQPGRLVPGVEGMMIVGAACGVGGAYFTGSVAAGPP